MSWKGILVNWEAPLFWAFLGLIGGGLIARHYYKKTGEDLKSMRDEIIAEINKSAASEDVKATLRAKIADSFARGIFHTYSWEEEYAKKLSHK